MSDKQTLTYQIAQIAVETGIPPQALMETTPEMYGAIIKYLNDRSEAVRRGNSIRNKRR